MHMKTYNTIQWIKKYGDDFKEVWTNDQLTTPLKLVTLEAKGIPTISGLSTWTYDNAWKVMNRVFPAYADRI